MSNGNPKNIQIRIKMNFLGMMVASLIFQFLLFALMFRRVLVQTTVQPSVSQTDPTTTPITSSTTATTVTSAIMTTSLSSNICTEVEEGKVYQIQRNALSCVMDAYNPDTTVNNSIDTSTSLLTENATWQQFYVKKLSSNISDVYMIYIVQSNLVFDWTGNQMYQQNATGSIYQQFGFSQGPNDTCYIHAISTFNNYVISNDDQTTDCLSFTILTIMPKVNAVYQQWQFIDVNPDSPSATRPDSSTTTITPRNASSMTTKVTISNDTTVQSTAKLSSLTTATKTPVAVEITSQPTTSAASSTETRNKLMTSIRTSTDAPSASSLTSSASSSKSSASSSTSSASSSTSSSTTVAVAPLPPQIPFPMSPTLRVIAQILSSLGGFWVVGTVLTSIIIEFLSSYQQRSKSYETFLHQCEKIALLISHLFILFGLIRIDDPAICSMTAISLQFFFLVTFCFFFFEALQSYYIYTQVICSGMILSKKMTTFTCLCVPLIITAATASTSFDKLQSDFACWVNIGEPISYGSFVPVFIISVVTVIIIESIFTGHYPILPFTGKHQMHSADVNRHGLVIKFPLFCASWFSMVFAVYYQRFFLFPICFGLNTTLGWKVLFFHIAGNDKIWQKMKSIHKKICK